MPSLAKGRNIVNWKKADWAPYPGKGASAYSWAPIRPQGNGAGFYLMKAAPGSASGEHVHKELEAVVVLDGELVDSDGTVFGPGSCIAYAAGSKHHTSSPKGCTMLVWTDGPVTAARKGSKPGDAAKGRNSVNWKKTTFSLYPSLPPTSDPIYWSDVGCLNSDTGEGFYVVKFPPGASSALHEHMGAEHFTILKGELIDPDGTVYRTGDCVALEPGTKHFSHSPGGCTTAAFISGPLRTIHRRKKAA